jgi:hypothetical protein
MIFRKVSIAAIVVVAIASAGCGGSTSNKPVQNAQPVGEQKNAKTQGRGMPAPPPIEPIN